MPTLVGAKRASGIKTGAVSWPVSVGMGTRPGAAHEIDRNMLEQFSTPNLLDAIEKSGGRRFGYPLREED